MVVVDLAHRVDHHRPSRHNLAVGKSADGAHCDPYRFRAAFGGLLKEELVRVRLGHARFDLTKHRHAGLLVRPRRGAHMHQLHVGLDHPDLAEGVVAGNAGDPVLPQAGQDVGDAHVVHRDAAAGQPRLLQRTDQRPFRRGRLAVLEASLHLHPAPLDVRKAFLADRPADAAARFRRLVPGFRVQVLLPRHGRAVRDDLRVLPLGVGDEPQVGRGHDQERRPAGIAGHYRKAGDGPQLLYLVGEVVAQVEHVDRVERDDAVHPLLLHDLVGARPVDQAAPVEIRSGDRSGGDQPPVGVRRFGAQHGRPQRKRGPARQPGEEVAAFDVIGIGLRHIVPSVRIWCIPSTSRSTWSSVL